MFSICVATSAADRSALSVCRGGAVAVTSICSEITPASIVSSPSASLSLAFKTIPGLSSLLNPGASILIVYVPGGTCGKTNRPDSSDLVEYVKFCCCSFAVTTTFGNTACCASTTLPAIEPLVVCANPTLHNITSETSIVVILDVVSLCIDVPPFREIPDSIQLPRSKDLPQHEPAASSCAI